MSVWVYVMVTLDLLSARLGAVTVEWMHAVLPLSCLAARVLAVSSVSESELVLVLGATVLRDSLLRDSLVDLSCSRCLMPCCLMPCCLMPCCTLCMPLTLFVVYVVYAVYVQMRIMFRRRELGQQNRNGMALPSERKPAGSGAREVLNLLALLLQQYKY